MTDSSSLVHDLRRLEAEALTAIAAVGAPAALEARAQAANRDERGASADVADPVRKQVELTFPAEGARCVITFLAPRQVAAEIMAVGQVA